MSHAIYQTTALVVSTKAMRESNVLAILYTEDFGLLYVGAQSIREQASKMKFHLHTGSLVDVDIVKGKELWKLTGIHEKVPSLGFVRTPWYPLTDRLTSLIVRLCKGEEANDALWNELALLYSLIQEDHPFDPIIEVIVIARILHSLGYWSGNDSCITSAEPYSREVQQESTNNKRILIQKINEALRDSQL